MNTNHDAGDEPDDGGDKAEGFRCLPSAAAVVVGDAAPVPDAAAAELVDGINKDTKRGEPGQRDDDVNWNLAY